jgi:hypothetical protein
MGDGLYRVILAVTLAAGLMAMSGCSSSAPASNTSNLTPPVTYSLVLTGTDADIEATHSVTVQVIVD